jgi:hypothetical protein
LDIVSSTDFSRHLHPKPWIKNAHIGGGSAPYFVLACSNRLWDINAINTTYKRWTVSVDNFNMYVWSIVHLVDKKIIQKNSTVTHTHRQKNQYIYTGLKAACCGLIKECVILPQK